MEGKESISVDLRTPGGRAFVHDIMRRADVFLNGFRPGIAERQGLDYETLKALNPDLLYFHASGYGVDGEYAPRPIFAGCAAALAGTGFRQAAFWMDPSLTADMSVMELQEVILPRLRGVTDGDSNAALAASFALISGLYHLRRTGQGQFVSTSMIGGNLWAYADDAVRYAGKPPLPSADPDLNGLGALYRLYETAEGWMFLAAPSDKEWRQLAAALDRPELAQDDRFTSVGLRQENDEALAAELESVFAKRTASEWEATLAPQGIGCVAVFHATMSEFTNTDPVLKETGLVTEVEHPAFGRILRHGPLLQFSETPGRIAPGCLVGQHTRAIMDELGYSAEQIAELEASEAVFSNPVQG
jgi:crotonobetainyl-CoA:carnitine CoA-transferase CaiB-like acyl-CoA transferase